MDENLWYIHGIAYDLEEFKKTHPGGKRALEMMKGQDCTEMFEAYHSLFTKPKQMMIRFVVDGKALLQYAPSFEWDPSLPVNNFQNELRAEVRELVDNKSLYLKMSCLKIGLVSVAYLLNVCFTLYFWLYQARLWALPLTPLGFWIIGVNSFHDASHFAVHRTDAVNNLFRYAHPWFSSPTMWDHQHVIAHHCYTNMPDRDPDLRHGLPWVRLHPLQIPFPSKIVWFYRGVMWLTATLVMSTVHDLWATCRQSYHGVKSLPVMSCARTTVHVLGRIFSVLLVGGVPILWFLYQTLVQDDEIHANLLCFFTNQSSTGTWSVTTDRASCGGLLAPCLFAALWAVGKGLLWASSFYMIFGLCFMSQTQINHITESCLQAPGSLRQASNTRRVLGSWSVHQAETSLNFATDSAWWFLFSGGLNHQIEHHLFPGLSHELLPLLRPIVQRLCAKHGVNYPCAPSFWQALSAHFSQMSHLGTESWASAVHLY
jgi:fatty acid desaturase